jgi:hypothetical protein
MGGDRFSISFRNPKLAFFACYSLCGMDFTFLLCIIMSRSILLTFRKYEVRFDNGKRNSVPSRMDTPQI